MSLVVRISYECDVETLQLLGSYIDSYLVSNCYSLNYALYLRRLTEPLKKLSGNTILIIDQKLRSFWVQSALSNRLKTPVSILSAKKKAQTQARLTL